MLRICFFIASITVLLWTPASSAQEAQTPRDLLNKWVALWGSYDLDAVESLFIQDDRLTYFSSEYEGLIRGYDAILEHHRGFGFVPGGKIQTEKIWVDEVELVPFGETVLIAAIWYFGDPQSPLEAQRGPMTVLAVPTKEGYRIGHMNFATYEGQEE